MRMDGWRLQGSSSPCTCMGLRGTVQNYCSELLYWFGVLFNRLNRVVRRSCRLPRPTTPPHSSQPRPPDPPPHPPISASPSHLPSPPPLPFSPFHVCSQPPLPLPLPSPPAPLRRSPTRSWMAGWRPTTASTAKVGFLGLGLGLGPALAGA
jgi:hypothetical protein